MQINVKTWISIWLKIIFEIKHASHSLPSASQSYSNYPTIGILVLLSWIPASKDFVNKVANTGNRITSLIENKNVLVLNSTTCITSWKRLPAEQRSLGEDSKEGEEWWPLLNYEIDRVSRGKVKVGLGNFYRLNYKWKFQKLTICSWVWFKGFQLLNHNRFLSWICFPYLFSNF